MMEYKPASGDRPTLQACLDMVEEAEVVIVLVAERYGWVPDYPTNTEQKALLGWSVITPAMSPSGKF